MAATSFRAFRVLGTTTDITVCGLCGRDELRGTVVLQPLDTDGQPDGDPAYYGSSCGAKAAGWTTHRIQDAAKAADSRKGAAIAADAKRQRAADFAAWLFTEHGVPLGSDPRDWLRLTGMRGYELRHAYGRPV